MAKTPATNPDPAYDMRMSELYDTQDKPASNGESGQPRPTKLPYDNGFDCRKAGEYEDGEGEGCAFD